MMYYLPFFVLLAIFLMLYLSYLRFLFAILLSNKLLIHLQISTVSIHQNNFFIKPKIHNYSLSLISLSIVQYPHITFTQPSHHQTITSQLNPLKNINKHIIQNTHEQFLFFIIKSILIQYLLIIKDHEIFSSLCSTCSFRKQ